MADKNMPTAGGDSTKIESDQTENVGLESVSDEDKKTAEELKEKANGFFKSI